MAGPADPGREAESRLDLLSNLEDVRQVTQAQHSIVPPNYRELETIYPQWASKLEALCQTNCPMEQWMSSLAINVGPLYAAIEDMSNDNRHHALLYVTEVSTLR